MLDGEKAMVRFLHLIAAEPDISRVPVMIDSSKWDIIESGLKCIQGRGLLTLYLLKKERRHLFPKQKKLRFLVPQLL